LQRARLSLYFWTYYRYDYFGYGFGGEGEVGVGYWNALMASRLHFSRDADGCELPVLPEVNEADASSSFKSDLYKWREVATSPPQRPVVREAWAASDAAGENGGNVGEHAASSLFSSLPYLTPIAEVDDGERSSAASCAVSAMSSPVCSSAAGDSPRLSVVELDAVPELPRLPRRSRFSVRSLPPLTARSAVPSAAGGGPTTRAAAPLYLPEDFTASPDRVLTGWSTIGPARLRVARVLIGYEAQDDAELSLRVGDVVAVASEDDSGWWKGTVLVRDGVDVLDAAAGDGDGATAFSGWFPYTCVEWLPPSDAERFASVLPRRGRDGDTSVMGSMWSVAQLLHAPRHGSTPSGGDDSDASQVEWPGKGRPGITSEMSVDAVLRGGYRARTRVVDPVRGHETVFDVEDDSSAERPASRNVIWKWNASADVWEQVDEGGAVLQVRGAALSLPLRVCVVAQWVSAVRATGCVCSVAWRDVAVVMPAGGGRPLFVRSRAGRQDKVRCGAGCVHPQRRHGDGAAGGRRRVDHSGGLVWLVVRTERANGAARLAALRLRATVCGA
jgi:hypothetical protein